MVVVELHLLYTDTGNNLYTCRVHLHVFGLPGKKLMELQSKVEDVECLPTLSVNDIERRTEPDPFVIQHKGRIDC